jgi:hypothetical protein
MKNNFEEAVQRGMSLLDERMPNWRARISLVHLNIWTLDSCILGQIFEGGYTCGLDVLCDERGNRSRQSFAEHYGFNTSDECDNDSPEMALQAAWVAALSAV